MRVAWLTDVHLNFLTIEQSQDFLNYVRSVDPDIVLISGDIAEAHDLVQYLELIDDTLGCPIYFVLGNHDYYHGQISAVRVQVRELCARRPRLSYLSQDDAPMELAPNVALVGHDGWADGRYGDYERSLVEMNDNRFIADLAGHDKLERWSILQSLGDEAAAHLHRVLPLALDRYENVFVLTHVPPMREACWHQGQPSNDEWAPHFTCKAVGDVLLDLGRLYPHRQITVLCGHTHSPGKCRPLRNLRVYTGGAEYSAPEIQKVFEF
jgi:Icc protein